MKSALNLEIANQEAIVPFVFSSIVFLIVLNCFYLKQINDYFNRF